MRSVVAASLKDAVMKSQLTAVVHKRLERFVTLFAKTLVNDTPDTVHDLRVASRRLQQTLRLLWPKSPGSGVRKLYRFLRKTRRAFGSCRNLDVSIGIIQNRRAATAVASLHTSWDAMRQWLEDQRTTAIADARTDLKRLDLIDFVSRFQARIDHFERQSSDNTELWQRAKDALASWKEALAVAKQHTQVERIHAFRIAGKQLRYSVESLAEVEDPSLKPWAQRLKQLQDELGSWHDRRVLQQFVSEFVARPGLLAEEPGICRALLLEMERDKRRDRTMIQTALEKAEKLSAAWTEIQPSETLPAISLTNE